MEKIKNMTNSKENPSNDAEEKLKKSRKEFPRGLSIPGIEGEVGGQDKFISKENNEVFLFGGLHGKTGKILLIPEKVSVDYQDSTRSVEGSIMVPVDNFSQKYERAGGQIFFSTKLFRLKGDEFVGAENFTGQKVEIVETDKSKNKVKVSSHKTGNREIDLNKLSSNIAVQENDYIVYVDSQNNIKMGKVIDFIGGKLKLEAGAGASAGHTVEMPEAEFHQILSKAKTVFDANKIVKEESKRKDSQSAEELIEDIKGIDEVDWNQIEKERNKIEEIIEDLRFKELKISEEKRRELQGLVDKALSENSQPVDVFNALKNIRLKVDKHLHS